MRSSERRPNGAGGRGFEDLIRHLQSAAGQGLWEIHPQNKPHHRHSCPTPVLKPTGNLVALFAGGNKGPFQTHPQRPPRFAPPQASRRSPIV
jgi:hypothetical protein